jgi:ABC-type multidrug transport system ATPase subunit
MRLALTETRGDHIRHEFDQPVVVIGRDPSCDLVFDQAAWPMVSRTHAELRMEDRRCVLIDKNSTQGTLINGQRVVKPTEIKTGAQIQFGQNGPVLTMEILADAPIGSAAKQPVATNRDPLATTAKSGAEPAFEFPVLIFESGVAPERGTHLPLNSETTVLGRDLMASTPEGAGASVVSRRHAEIRRDKSGQFFVEDLKSFNGTLVNSKRISQQTPLHNGDRIQLSVGGPMFRFYDPASTPKPSHEKPAPTAAVSFEGLSSSGSGDNLHSIAQGLGTLVYRAGSARLQQPGAPDKAKEQLLAHCTFEGKQSLSVGRGKKNDIQLDGLLISKHHASFIRTPQHLVVEDEGSTNGVYVNGERIAGRQPVKSDDIVQIGPFVLKADPIIGVKVFDTRSETRIDAVNITQEVPSLWGDGTFKLLDQVSLAIEPNEFVGLLGPSGAGKSTLMNALNGMNRTTGGRVFVNNLDLYQHLYSIKQSIGYVPQDDIIHRELTCYDTLYYVGRLRLSRDVPTDDINQIINEVLEVTGLADRRDALISQLSGGQRKRVSIAVELITKPSLIFLDEPTSGLDPSTEERIMKLFRQIAESGRTVIMTTHAMENVQLFDKIVLLMRGKLIFCGTPKEALKFAGAKNFIDLYNNLEHPASVEAASLSVPSPKASKTERRAYEKRYNEILETTAEQWRNRFLLTETYQRTVFKPLSHLLQREPVKSAVYRRPGTIDTLLQLGTLIARYARVLSSDRLNLLILFTQAPIIALLTYLVVGAKDSRDFVYFVLALVPLWFGISIAAREIVKERSVFKRERMVNLRLLPYVGSKLFTLSCLVSVQCLLLFGTLKLLDLAKLMEVPGVAGGLAQWLTMVLTGIVGIALGLFVSVLVRTSEVATSIVPLILIPQILLCGLMGVPEGLSRVVGAAMPATWSFDQMKRLSTLDTLRREGSDPSGKNEGDGLFDHIKKTNESKLQNTRSQLENYTRRTNESLKEYDRRIKSSIERGDVNSIASAKPPAAQGTPPQLPNYEGITDDLRKYVTFKHPWGGVVINTVMLLIMVFVFLGATLIVLHVQDSRAMRNKRRR